MTSIALENLGRSRLCNAVALAVWMGFLPAAACGDSKESLTIAEALATNAEKKLEESGNYKPPPKKPAPTMELPPPTEEELAAWDRKDPGGEKHLYKWDKRNLKRMSKYWFDLQCFRDKMRDEGEKARGAEPQGPQDEQWYQFKRMFIPFINRWQQRLFTLEPRILEKSKFISNFLEAHELVMNGYPNAYNTNDEIALKKVDAHWLIVEAKINRYVEQLGGGSSWKIPDLEKASNRKKWQSLCENAMKEPKVSTKKRRRSDP